MTNLFTNPLAWMRLLVDAQKAQLDVASTLVDAGKTMLATLNAGGLVGLLADRDITGDGIEVTLLGRRTKVPAGPATLALRSGAVLLGGIVYSGPGREHCVIMRPVNRCNGSAITYDLVMGCTDRISNSAESVAVTTIHGERNPKP